MLKAECPLSGPCFSWWLGTGTDWEKEGGKKGNQSVLGMCNNGGDKRSVSVAEVIRDLLLSSTQGL